MHDARLVRGGQRRRDLHRNGERLVQPHLASLIQDLPQGLAIDEFGRDELTAVGSAGFVNRENARMIEGGRRGGFLREPPDAVLVLGVCAGENLQRDVAAKPRISSAIHLAHAALADFGEDPVRAKRLADLQSRIRYYVHLVPVVPGTRLAMKCRCRARGDQVLAAFRARPQRSDDELAVR